MAAAHKTKKESSPPEQKTRCPKCKSANLLIIGEKGDRTLSCLDCNYTEGMGAE